MGEEYAGPSRQRRRLLDDDYKNVDLPTVREID